MALRIPCPHCGNRPFTEFWCGGEITAIPPGREDLEANFGRVWMRENRAGVHVERWYHVAGCRRWVTLSRDTRTNQVVGQPGSGVTGQA